MRLWGTLVAAGSLVVLTSCGSATAPGPGDQPDDAGQTTTAAPPDATAPDAAGVVDPDAELVGVGIVMQRSKDAEPELCLGGVAESYPPQCGGPVLKGEFSWDDVTAEKASGVTWTNDPYWAVGHLDRSGGGEGTFTLTRPLSAKPPEGAPSAGPDHGGFPQLCDDPTADVPDVDQDARTAGPEGFEEEQALLQAAEHLDGYVTMWLSDGGPTMNVVVNAEGDAEAARAELRKVFQGPLCVEQRDLPSNADLMAAQQALGDRMGELGLMSSGGGGVSGLLEVQALVADRATVDAIHEAVAEWLTPDQVVISSTLRPLGG